MPPEALHRPTWIELADVLVHRAAVAVAAAVLLHAAPASAESVTGIARVIDGDTLEVAGTRVRLYGVDAPESKQLCKRRNGEDYACGATQYTSVQGLTGQRS